MQACVVGHALEAASDRFERVAIPLLVVRRHRVAVKRPRLTPVDPLVRLAGCSADGEAVDATPGTLVFVGPESRRKATGDGTVIAVGGAPGEAYQGIDWGEAWPFHEESMKAYGEQRYADALEAVRGGLEHMPDHAGLHYNYACFATLAGDTGDDTFAHLRRSVELFPRFREDARRDADFAAVRDDPRFEEALR